MKLLNTKTKLEDARTSLALLKKTKSPLEYRMAFSAFINNSRAITYALQKDASGDEKLELWYKSKQVEMKNDELLRFIHDTRIDDFHKGAHKLDFASKTKFTNLDPSRVLSRSPDAFTGTNTWNFSLTGEGLFTTINVGTPQEKRVELDQTLIDSKVVTIRNPPSSHLGKPLQTSDPTYICEIAMVYYENFVFEANTYIEQK